MSTKESLQRRSVIWRGVVNPLGITLKLFRYTIWICFNISFPCEFHRWISVMGPVYAIRRTGVLEKCTDDAPRWLRMRSAHLLGLIMAQSGLWILKEECYLDNGVSEGFWLPCIACRISIGCFILKYFEMAPWIGAERGCKFDATKIYRKF